VTDEALLYACLDAARYGAHATQRAVVLLQQRGIGVDDDHEFREAHRQTQEALDTIATALRQRRGSEPLPSCA